MKGNGVRDTGYCGERKDGGRDNSDTDKRECKNIRANLGI